MKIPNPRQIIQRRQTREAVLVETKELLMSRLEVALSKKNHEEQRLLTNALKAKNIHAVVLKDLTESAARDVNFFLKREIRIMKGGQEKAGSIETLADVKDRDLFSRILIVMRNLYADDIAEHITCEDAARAVVEKLFFHSS
jgi:hypothetical protein